MTEQATLTFDMDITQAEVKTSKPWRDEPYATEKQVDFIKTLLMQIEQKLPNIRETMGINGLVLTKKGASMLIDELLEKKKGLNTLEHGSEKKADVIENPGFFLHDGTVYSVVWNQSKTNMYAKVLVEKLDGTSAKYEYAKGAMGFLKESMRITVEQAAELGHHHGYCVICGAELTNPESVERGIGPVCITKI